MKPGCGCHASDPTHALCGCCVGTTPLTPLPTANRPGLPALASRIGTHATFLETMRARLSSSEYQKLAALTTRDADDPAVALLDGWATIADVLTFYQERIANEGYLRTATERRSILELARLVGYELRPGVAASVYLAYTLEKDYDVTIPAGGLVKSIPGPGEMQQSFETAEPLRARAVWNNLQVRLTQPQTSSTITAGPRVYVKGIFTNLRQNDPLLIDFGGGRRELFRVVDVTPDAAADRTRLTLRVWTGNSGPGNAPESIPTDRDTLLSSAAFRKRPSLQPANPLRLQRALAEITPTSDMALQLTTAFQPAVRSLLRPALTKAVVTSGSPIRVYALRVKAALFGHNAPKRQRVRQDGEVEVIGEWPIVRLNDQRERENELYLDSSYDQILGGSWIVVDTSNVRPDGEVQITPITPADQPYIIAQAGRVQSQIARAEYGISSKTTHIELDHAWINIQAQSPNAEGGELNRIMQPFWDRDFQVLRRTVVYAQSEELELDEEPIEPSVCGTDGEIELDGLYDGLQAGRWLAVAGERTDIPHTSGVKATELVMLAEVRHDVKKVDEGTTDLPGDKLHTFIKLANNLAYCYKRDTVKIYGNVVKATQGETRREVLGSGDGSKTLQQFTLKQPPLTYVSAANPSGIESTLQVFVNDVRWHAADMLAGLGPTTRCFITKTDDEGKTAIIFGNGKEGARLPTGLENVGAIYRSGIGKAGNVKAEQISMLGDRPLGVKEVINPLPAAGGANKESRDQARQNAPLAMMALDRLVSTQDYADFARTFAGIGKASAVRLSDGAQQLVYVTIAGVEDGPIDEQSDLYRNLRLALRRFGDPYQALHIARREWLLLVISANVRVRPGYVWESVDPKTRREPVEPRIRQALLDTFSFERRELGQDALLSKAISVIQHIDGVDYVDVDVFGGVPEKKVKDTRREFLTPTEIAEEIQKIVHDNTTQGPTHRVRVHRAGVEGRRLHPAQIAYLTSAIPATLILKEIPR